MARRFSEMFVGPSGVLSPDATFYPSQMPAPARIENPANIGASKPVTLTTGLQAATETQLLAAQLGTPRQVVVTVAQAASLLSGVTPWAAPFDGGAFSAAPPFNAPNLPGADLWAMRLRLRWGAGGVSFLALFDYPTAGGSFGVTADCINLDVVWWDYATNTLGAPTFAAAADVPVVGAFYVEGIAADGTPLRYREKPAVIGAGVPNALAWSVKPFAREFRFASPTPAPALSFLIEQLDASGSVLWAERYAGSATQGIAVVAPVVPQAVAVRAVNESGVLALAQFEWRVGLT